MINRGEDITVCLPVTKIEDVSDKLDKFTDWTYCVDGDIASNWRQGEESGKCRRMAIHT